MRRRQYVWLAALVFLIAPQLLSQTPSDQFTIVALPDTQFYSKTYPDIFTAQTQWIVNNQKTMNIQLVLGLGDIVDAAGKSYEWTNAVNAVNLMNGKVPYLMAIGNHDYDASDPAARGATAFNKYFGPSRYTNYSWYRGNYPAGSNENFYGTFVIGGRAYLVLVLELFPRNGALQWAASILAANPDKDVIVVTHAYIYYDNFRFGPCDSWNNIRMGMTSSNSNDGEQMWTKFLSKYKNIVMVLNGHVADGDGVGRRQDLGVNGNLVNQMLSDYQSYPYGGGGYLRILTVTPSQNTIAVKTYSPWTNTYKTDSQNQFTVKYSSDGTFSGNGSIYGKVRNVVDCSDVSSEALTTSGGSATSSTYGYFAISNLTPGSRTVTGVKSGWVTASSGATVQSGLPAQARIITAPAGWITGKVSTSSGTGIGGASVNIKGGALSANKTVTTDSTGHYSSGATAVGSYTVTVSATNYGSDSATTSVTAGATSTLDFALVSTAASTCSQPTSAGVHLCSPASGSTVSSPVSVVAAVTTAATLVRTELWVDGTKITTVYANTLDTSVALAGGSHKITVIAVDSAGAKVSASAGISVSP
jgi:carboxypeptidase family protein/calcineurin-like phosphoesterase family protein